ncbi:MAG: hypothetical protein M1147_08270 [Nitrospirae bacterium]|nr:hypothetical protein [Nitrospirota bacterium]MCL5978096.1 hypothetical protein [Nitrospirota bacterium]
MKKTGRIGFLMVLLIFALTACATGGVNTPLPQTINIEQPGPDVSKEVAEYVGVWEGVWDLEIYGKRSFRAMSVTIVIEKITSNKVTAIYSWGDRKTYVEEGWTKLDGKIENGKIILRGYANIELEKTPGSKTVSAIYRRDNWSGNAVLFKKDPKDLQQLNIKKDLSHLPEKIRAYNGTWEGSFDNGTPIIEDITVISEKKVLVTHSWGNNPLPRRANIKAGSWPQIETEFNKDGYISITRENRILTIKLNKDGTLLDVGLEPTGGGWYVSGDLKKR